MTSEQIDHWRSNYDPTKHVRQEKPMSYQEQIDKICTWMGWHKRSWQVEYDIIIGHRKKRQTYWCTEEKPPKRKGYTCIVPVSDFDPSKNPSDCARVMDEVVKRGHRYSVVYMPKERLYEAAIWDGCNIHEAMSTDSESEAKMNALSEMIL